MSSSGEKRSSGSRPAGKLNTPADENATMTVAFWAAVVASQVIGVIVVALVIYFATQYGGFAWTSNADLQFNYHPVFMVIGLVFFYGDALLAYRVLPRLPKLTLKIIHAALHGGAIVLATIALVAIFENHRRTNRADLYSLHSWIGLATFVMFAAQYASGFVTFLFPGLPLSVRSGVMPFHRFFGLAVFILAIASSLMGLTQKLIWTTDYTSGKSIPKGAVGNTLGILMTVFGFLVVFLVTTSGFKRKPLDAEIPPGDRHSASVN